MVRALFFGGTWSLLTRFLMYYTDVQNEIQRTRYNPSFVHFFYTFSILYSLLVMHIYKYIVFLYTNISLQFYNFTLFFPGI